jgi:glycosyltransferase involved in cell wall biosynthesis
VTVPTFVVVPTKDRPGYLNDCVTSLTGQAELIIVVDNGSTPPVRADRPSTLLIRHVEYPPNISRLWNLGIDEAAQIAAENGLTAWNVLVVNDDVIAPPNLVEVLSAAMRAEAAACAYPDQFEVGRRVLHTRAVPVLTVERICGYAFMLRGEAGMRADEGFVWWFGDDDIDWRARQAGGSLLVPGVRVEHRAPDVQTRADPILSEQTNADHRTWVAKWGYDRPVLM